MVDLSGDPNIFPNTGIALATRTLADRVNWLAVVDQLLPWDPLLGAIRAQRRAVDACHQRADATPPALSR